MPIKFKPSVTDRKGKTQNYYMRSTTLESLRAAMESGATPKKRKEKIRKELIKRGITLTPAL
jgi:hypothetical protein|tara:strand:- start:1199 stop:1384 length:186 start_codon:yes stop_codon:yes gene_type:complete